MKRNFIFLLALLFSVSVFSKENTTQSGGSALSALLQKIIDQEQIHPDSLFTSLRSLEQRRREAKSPEERAMYATVLGKLYAERTWRSQSRYQETEAHLDSIQEWSREQYLVTAAERFCEALQDKDLLFSMPTRTWIPLVIRGEDDAVFGSNMLYVVWQEAIRYLRATRNNAPKVQAASAGIPTPAEMADYYKKKGLREAAFLVEFNATTDGVLDNTPLTTLQRLMEEYADLDVSVLAATVYYKLLEEYAETEPMPKEERYAALEALLRKFPKGVYRSTVKNEMNEYKSPSFNFRYPVSTYTGDEFPIAIERKNLTSYTLSLYQLPKNFDENSWRKQKDGAGWIRKNARLVATRRQSVSPAPFKVLEDTARFTCPAHGRYAILADAQTSMPLHEKPKTVVQFMHATRMSIVKYTISNRVHYVVLDAKSGAPIPDAKASVQYIRHERQLADTLNATFISDARGVIEIARKPNYHASVRFSHGDDLSDMTSEYFSSVSNTSVNSSLPTYVINTDRAIYRPGQTIHIGGVVYSQNGWNALVLTDQKVRIRLGDTRDKIQVDTTVVTDDFGCFSLSLPIPATAELGRWWLHTDRSTTSISVEEYRRPTFEVKMDEAQLADSIRFTGVAKSYAGVPVQKARVRARYQWTPLWSRGWVDAAPLPADTVWTDSDGRFLLQVPKTLSAEQLRRGCRLVITVDVLSESGETQSAVQTATLCSEPLRLYASVSEMQDKDRLKTWRFDLLDALNKPVEADVKVRFFPVPRRGKGLESVENIDEFGNFGTSPLLTLTLPANKDLKPEQLKSIPSGRYIVRAEAVVKGDSARAKSQCVFFSMDDSALPVDTVAWFYAPNNVIAPDQPAKIQVGSSLQDVRLFCLVVSDTLVLRQEMLTFSDSLFTLTIPYDKRMGKAARAHLFFVKDGQCHRQSFDLRLPMPDNKLKAHWETFRDKLRPGQQETWRLTLTQPDGTPARANLLATLYDASLDALSPHRLSLDIRRSYPHIGGEPWQVFSSSQGYGWYNFILKREAEKGFRPSRLNDTYFIYKATTRAGFGNGQMKIRGAAPLTMSKQSVTADFDGIEVIDLDEALAGRVAGLEVRSAKMMAAEGTGAAILSEPAITYDTSSEMAVMEEAEDDASVVNPALLRQNFAETAFFYPTLRSNAQGEIALEFTLPESLTRWHLLGVAHTEDMLVGQIDETIVAQKELMAQLFLPRFLRQGDKATLTALIQNVDEENVQAGKATFEILDAETERVLLRKKVEFNLPAKRDTVYTFDYATDRAHPALICRWVAEGSACSDGEQRLLPVLDDTETIVRTKALWLNAQGERKVDLAGMFPKDATDRLTVVEYTTHPIWSAIEALPSLLAPRHDDVLTQTATYYAASLSLHLRSTVPGCLPSENRDSLDLARVRALNKVKAMQLSDGSFAWFPGMNGSTYMTREVAFLLARLYTLLPEGDADASDLAVSAVGFLRKQMDSKTKFDTNVLRHLYIVSRLGLPLDKNEKRLLGEMKAKELEKLSLEDRALAAIVLSLQEKGRTTNRVMEGVEKYLVGTPETGRYVDYPSGSFTSIDRKIQIHTQIMEAVHLTRPASRDLWNGLQQWLLQEKRTTDWTTPTNTVDAVYALLLGGRPELEDAKRDVLTVRGKGDKQILSPKDDKMGYLKDTLTVRQPQTLTISKQSAGESWGAVYAQFTQQIDSVSAAWQGVNIRREISSLTPAKAAIKRELTGMPDLPSESRLGVAKGDRIHVRYVLTATRDYDYILLHAPRPAATEPTHKTSGRTYQNGLSCYRTVRDDATDYYIEHLPKGTYVLEEDILVERQGTYHAGITSLQCLYAPEFRAHTGNLKLSVGE